MSKGPWLSAIQRHALAESYFTLGLEATKHLAASYGIKVRTIAYVARRYGKSRPRPVAKPKQPKVRMIDRRWAWAIERGAVAI